MFESYKMPQTERVTTITNYLGRKGLQFLEILTQAEQERCNAMEGLFNELISKVTPQYNETLKLLQFHKLDK